MWAESPARKAKTHWPEAEPYRRGGRRDLKKDSIIRSSRRESINHTKFKNISSFVPER
jgi:hypothetical protein